MKEQPLERESMKLQSAYEIDKAIELLSTLIAVCLAKQELARQEDDIQTIYLLETEMFTLQACRHTLLWVSRKRQSLFNTEAVAKYVTDMSDYG